MKPTFEAELAVRGTDRTHLLPRARPGDAASDREVALKDCIAADGVLAAIEGMASPGEAPSQRGERK